MMASDTGEHNNLFESLLLTGRERDEARNQMVVLMRKALPSLPNGPEWVRVTNRVMLAEEAHDSALTAYCASLPKPPRVTRCRINRHNKTCAAVRI